MMVVERITGKKANFASKDIIIEAFKKEKINTISSLNTDINDRLKNNNILKFY